MDEEVSLWACEMASMRLANCVGFNIAYKLLIGGLLMDLGTVGVWSVFGVSSLFDPCFAEVWRDLSGVNCIYCVENKDIFNQYLSLLIISILVKQKPMLKK